MDFIAFVDRIREALTRVVTAEEQRKKFDNGINNAVNGDDSPIIIPWNWLCQNLILLLQRFPKGVTEVALLTDLHQMWEDYSVQWKSGFANAKDQINTIYESNAISADEIYQLEIDSVKEDKNGNMIVSLSDNVSSKNIDLILHRQSSIFKSAHTKYNLLVSGRRLKLAAAQMLYDVPTALDKNINVCLLPTDFIIFTLGQEDLNKFSQFSTADQIVNNQPSNMIKGVLLRTSHEPARQRKRLYLYADKNNQNTFITLILQGDALVRYQKMLKKNDTIFVENPEWSEGFAFIGHETVLFVLPQSLKQEFMSYCSPSKPASQSQFRTQINEEGVKDMKYFPERITPRDWKPKTSGNSLLLKLSGKQYQNQPIANGRSITRYVFLCEDLAEGKSICVTIYDSVGLKAAQCLAGSIMFIMGVDIDGERETNNTVGQMWTAYCSKKSKGEVYNVSELAGLVNSLSLLPLRALKDSVEQRLQSFIVKADFIDFEFLNPPTHYIHSTCYGPIAQTGPSIYKCSSCFKMINFDEKNIAELKSAYMLPFASQSPIKATPNSHVAKHNVPPVSLIDETSSEIGISYNVKWTISDGTTELDVFAAPRVDNELLRISAKEFQNLPDAKKATVLPALAWYRISLSLYDSAQKMYRIDQIAPVNFAAEVRNWK
jgi:hypothetical protein